MAIVKMRVWGTTTAITIPKEYRKLLDWKEGDLIQIQFYNFLDCMGLFVSKIDPDVIKSNSFKISHKQAEGGNGS